MAYSPKELGLTLSYECDLKCSHCIVKAGPKEKGTINPEVTAKVLDQARSNGITNVLLYGGEPFLQRDLMLSVADQLMSKRFNVYINSNGSWGKTRESARENLSDLRKLLKKYRSRYLGISLSVDEYHQPQVPIDSIANIIAEHRLGEFPRVQIDISSQKGEESNKTLADLLVALYKQGIHLAISKFHPFLYAALPHELKEYGRKERKNLIANLDLPHESSDSSIEKALSSNLSSRHKDKWYEDAPLIYSCHTSLSPFVPRKTCMIIPDNYLIKLSRGELIMAGRSTEGRSAISRTSKALFIDPYGKAYPYPALMRSEEGVSIEDKPLSQVIYEVGESFK
jgi:organic radical activating enzyme